MSGSQGNLCLIDMLDFAGFLFLSQGHLILQTAVQGETQQEYSFLFIRALHPSFLGLAMHHHKLL
jgi:hypothetical protein